MVLMKPKSGVELLLHNIRSVYNVGAIFRTAECLGVSKIWLSGYTPTPVDRFGRVRSDFHKVALGTEDRVPWQVVPELSKLIEDKKSSGYQIVALEQTNDSVPLQSYIPEAPILLMPGTETTGVDESLLQLCDLTVEIQQSGTKESLNIHAAISIALWHMLK
jgi:tRNA G18 (ribose-2'-O)-methylase SpoU